MTWYSIAASTASDFLDLKIHTHDVGTQQQSVPQHRPVTTALFFAITVAIPAGGRVITVCHQRQRLKR
jgi:hypothetical protein